jgi:hypothetical protein
MPEACGGLSLLTWIKDLLRGREEEWKQIRGRLGANSIGATHG